MLRFDRTGAAGFCTEVALPNLPPHSFMLSLLFPARRDLTYWIRSYAFSFFRAARTPPFSSMPAKIF